MKYGGYCICKKSKRGKRRESEEAKAGAVFFCEKCFFGAVGPVDIIRIYRVTANCFYVDV